MRYVILIAVVGLALAAGVGTVAAAGFVVTYPPDSDNLSLAVGSSEDVEIHLKNHLGVEATVGISDDAESTISVSYPTDFAMSPGESKTVFLTANPISEGDFDIAVHVSWETPGGGEGGTGGQVIGGTDIPLEGNVRAPANQPPTADAGGPYSVDEGETVELNGTGSSDLDGAITDYSWTIIDDPTGEASLSDSSTATPVFHSPSVESDTNVTVELTVEDDDGAIGRENATVTVLAAPSPAAPSEPSPVAPLVVGTAAIALVLFLVIIWLKRTQRI